MSGDELLHWPTLAFCRVWTAAAARGLLCQCVERPQEAACMELAAVHELH